MLRLCGQVSVSEMLQFWHVSKMLLCWSDVKKSQTYTSYARILQHRKSKCSFFTSSNVVS